MTLGILQSLWPHAPNALLKGITASPALDPYSPLVQAHAMAQFSEETGGGTVLTENINYSALRASAVWPLRFSSAEDCYTKIGSFSGDPKFDIKLINNVYGGRNGNRPGTSDGSTFIGRGLAQVTGRANYDRLAGETGLDLLNQPDLVNTPENALKCGMRVFLDCGCLPYSEADDVQGVTRRLNGGLTNLDQRVRWLERWKAALAPVVT